MNVKKTFVVFVILSLLVNTVVFPFVNIGSSLAASLPVVDDFEAPLNYGLDANNIQIGFFAAQDGASGPTTFARTTTPPTPVPGSAAGNNVLQMNFAVSVWAVVIHGFENEGINQWISQDWSAYEGISFWLYGQGDGSSLFIDVIDNRNTPPRANDDAERYSITFTDNVSGWQQIKIPFASFTRKEIGNSAPNDGFTLSEVHGWAFGVTTPGTHVYYMDDASLYGTAPVKPLKIGFGASTFNVKEGRTANIVVKLTKPAATTVTVNYQTTDGTAVANRNYLPASGTLTFNPGITQQSFQISTLSDGKWQGNKSVLLQLSNPMDAELNNPFVAGLMIQETDPYDPSLLDDFNTQPYLFNSSPKTSIQSIEVKTGSSMELPGQGVYEQVLQAVRTGNNQSTLEFGRRFALGQDWRGNLGLNFWFYGYNSGRKVKVSLLDNQATDPGPTGWKLVWSDEFNTTAGTQPNPKTWGYELGDGTINGIPGWGNDELEYYTNSAENASTDGSGNLVITVKQADGSLPCYYGACQYTSARLLTKNRFEVAFGRIEARIKVPSGAGLWPAFWSLGTDIDRLGWPQAGEIDIMENVGRIPNEIFGTIHGPGYSGGQSFGRSYNFGTPAAADFHTFAVEWQPGEIRWYVDGILYHTATPADVAPNQWVFDHPFFLLLNVAVGGNFGGPVGADTVFPQSMLVDYVRLYQAPDTAERFEATFTDSFSGWQRVSIPFSAFKRSDIQPANAPNDGLTLSSVWGYGFKLPGNFTTPVWIDQVKVQPNCQYEVTVTSTADSGPGSLRQALQDVCFSGTVGFSSSLAGQTISLTSTELTLTKPVTIDGASAPGLVISGSDMVRPFVINPFVSATLRNLKITRGYGYQLAGGILNNGALALDHVMVTGNQVTTDGEDWWKGGAGIYNGDGSLLTLLNSTVSDNTASASNGGGIYAFFNSLVVLDRSTVSGNIANVGGGLRTLGDLEIINSTVSGNSSYGWHGGALFHTNGAVKILSSTITGNKGPDWAPSTLFIGSFDASVPSLMLTNTIIAGNQRYACDHWTGSSIVVSGGHNLIQDDTCNPVQSDLIYSDPQLGPLSDNGGSTWTHALLPGSPALDAGDDLVCPATDQRGVTRPQGSHCDMGAFEASVP